MAKSAEIFGSALLVQGSADLLADRVVDARMNAARKQRSDAELHDISAVGLETATLSEILGGSLFSSAVICTIRDLADASTDLHPMIIDAASRPHDELALTLVHPGGVKGKALIDALKKAKVPVEQVAEPKAWELPKFVTAEGKRAGISIDEEAARALIDSVGQDLRALAGAISQLATDTDDSRLTSQQIAKYFSGRAEVKGFQVVDDVLNSRTGEALVKLRWTLSTGTSTPVMLTAAFASGFRGLGKYLDLRAAHLAEPELARQVGVPPWKTKDLARQSRSWQPSAVAAAIRLIAAADADVKGAASDPEYALEHMILGIEQARTRH